MLQQSVDFIFFHLTLVFLFISLKRQFRQKLRQNRFNLHSLNKTIKLTTKFLMKYRNVFKLIILIILLYNLSSLGRKV